MMINCCWDHLDNCVLFTVNIMSFCDFYFFKGLYVRSRFTINPDKVYRMAMTKLNTSAGILEVMGAPLSGTDLRAYVMSGGGITLKNFKPSFRSKRCFLIFPIRGSERQGLVSVEVKKKKGQVCFSFYPSVPQLRHNTHTHTRLH